MAVRNAMCLSYPTRASSKCRIPNSCTLSSRIQVRMKHESLSEGVSVLRLCTTSTGPSNLCVLPCNSMSIASPIRSPFSSACSARFHASSASSTTSVCHKYLCGVLPPFLLSSRPLSRIHDFPVSTMCVSHQCSWFTRCLESSTAARSGSLLRLWFVCSRPLKSIVWAGFPATRQCTRQCLKNLPLGSDTDPNGQTCVVSERPELILFPESSIFRSREVLKVFTRKVFEFQAGTFFVFHGASTCSITTGNSQPC